LTDQFVIHSKPYKTTKQTLTGFGWISLASRCPDAGAVVLSPKGREFTENSSGATLATRNLMVDLRETDTITGGPFGLSLNPGDSGGPPDADIIGLPHRSKKPQRW